MKITKTRLKQIIKEELNKALNEECHPMDQDCHNQENWAWQLRRQAANAAAGEPQLDIEASRTELEAIEKKCYRNGKWQCGGALKVRSQVLHRFLKKNDPTYGV